MYYVIQVAPGMEDKTEMLIKRRVKKSVYGCCFHPLRHVRKKFRGEWRDLHEKLLPGYVFITSDSVKELYQELKQVAKMTKLLGTEGDYFISLEKTEAIWLEKWGKGEKTEVDIAGRGSNIENAGTLQKEMQEEKSQTEIGLSQVKMGADGFTILSGPLKGMDEEIKKLHLHKRLAEVEVEFMGKKKRIYLGIELLKEKETDDRMDTI